MKKTLEEIKRIEPDPLWGYAIQEINGRMYPRMLDRESYDKEAILFSSLKTCVEKLLNGCANAVKEAEKAIMKYERIESRTAGRERSNTGKKEENKPSVRGKMEILQMQQPERSGRVAEEKGIQDFFSRYPKPLRQPAERGSLMDPACIYFYICVKRSRDLQPSKRHEDRKSVV